MDELVSWCGVKILFTTGADKHECQAWALWDEADVVISIVEKTARVLKGSPTSLYPGPLYRS